MNNEPRIANIDLVSTFEDRAEAAIHDYVMTRAALGIYDPANPRRPKVRVVSFKIELLELDSLIVYAAGPVILHYADHEVERFLRASVQLTEEGDVAELAEFRAAYIEETDNENGACKETAALANE